MTFRRPLVIAAAASVIAGASIAFGQWWIAYGLLVGVTLWTSWKNEVVQAVGWALLVSWAGSNAAHWWVGPMDRPQAYSVCEVAVLSMAFFSHVLGASRAMVALVAVSMVSIGINFYVSSFDALTREQTNLWEMASNVCFVIENLLVIVPMAYDRSRDRLPRGWFRSALHGRSASSSGTFG